MDIYDIDSQVLAREIRRQALGMLHSAYAFRIAYNVKIVFTDK